MAAELIRGAMVCLLMALGTGLIRAGLEPVIGPLPLDPVTAGYLGWAGYTLGRALEPGA